MLASSILAVDYTGKKGAEYFQNRNKPFQEIDLSSVENELENPDQRADEFDLEYMSLLEEDQNTEYEED